MLLALLFVLLLTTVEANMSSLLTVYSLVRQADKSKAEISQANGVALTSIFWLGMATSRIFTAMCGKLLNSTKTLIFLLSLATLSSSFLAVFANGSTAVLWMGTLTLGTALGPVFPLSFCWLDQRIGLSPWASSLWLIAASFGRITGPVTTAYMMSVHGPILLPAMVVVGALLASVTFLFLQKAVKVAGHLRAVDELSRHVKDENSLRENGDAGGGLGSRYARLADEADDILEMDDFFSEDENVIHFDRSDHLQRSA
uniref:Uncharacterized protein n=1 Tax=Plectus sambesii TaxID=2011161 RepID=A0A914X0Y9_9BILA